MAREFTIINLAEANQHWIGSSEAAIETVGRRRQGPERNVIGLPARDRFGACQIGQVELTENRSESMLVRHALRSDG